MNKKSFSFKELLRSALYLLQNVNVSSNLFLLQQDNRIPVVKVMIHSYLVFYFFFPAAFVYKEYAGYNVLLYIVHNTAFLQPIQI